MRGEQEAARVESTRAVAGAPLPLSTIPSVFTDYFRCASELVRVDVAGELSAAEGYFRFRDAVCYGRRAGGEPASHAGDRLADVSDAVDCRDGRLRLPFDLSEVVTNLRQELYRQRPHSYLERITSARTARNIYYLLRPMLPVAVRKHLQRVRLRGWERIGFPRWPIDVTVDLLMQEVMALLLKHSGARRVPFVWFWPDGAPGCAMMTHDIESPAGEAFCDSLMDLDESFGIRSAFQVVPDVRHATMTGLVDKVRSRGFEVNVHDLSHDGSLFQDRERFLERAEQINRYARQLQCRGFRSGAMYREQRWYDALHVAYDMSVPNAAHLEPQRGGCCTVLPYFIGDILELPLTTTQDYSLFHILGEYSCDRWKQQAELLLSRNGLISFITHPDYLAEPRALTVYRDLLVYLRELEAERGVWIAPPSEIDRWWRRRARMTLVPDGGSWRIEGQGSGHARVAYASLDGDRVVYTVDGAR